MLKSNNFIVAVLLLICMAGLGLVIKHHLDTPIVEFSVVTRQPVYLVDPWTGSKSRVAENQLPERYQKVWASSVL